MSPSSSRSPSLDTAISHSRRETTTSFRARAESCAPRLFAALLKSCAPRRRLDRDRWPYLAHTAAVKNLYIAGTHTHSHVASGRSSARTTEQTWKAVYNRLSHAHFKRNGSQSKQRRGRSESKNTVSFFFFGDRKEASSVLPVYRIRTLESSSGRLRKIQKRRPFTS